MSASLEALIKFIGEKYTIEEIVGGSGCVKWISQVEDPDTVHDLEPGTLAVFGGLVIKTQDRLDSLISALSEAGAAGIIIAAELIPRERSIPVFRMPRETRIPRLIYDCGRFLIRQESKELTVVRAMKLILAESVQNESALRYLESHGFPEMSKYYLLCSDNLAAAGIPADGIRGCSFRYGDLMIYMICAGDFSKCGEFAKGVPGNIGVSDVFLSPRELPGAYRQAESAMKTSAVTGEHVVFYNRAGLFTLIRLVAGTSEARDFARNILGGIKKYDDENRTDYLGTLRAYIKCSGSVQDAADLLGIHRNTVNNKIRFIKENFGLSFDYAGITAICAALAICEISPEKGEI